MKPLESYIDRILTRFSFTDKIKFIMSIGYISVALLLFIIFYLLMGPLWSIHAQKIGLNYLKELNLITEKIQRYLIIRDSIQHKKSLEIAINSDLYHFRQNIEKWVQDEANDNFHVKMVLFSQYWDQIRTTGVKRYSPELVDGFYSAYLGVINQIALFSNLNFNIDTGTSYLINAINVDLPSVQKGIMMVLLSKFNIQNGINQAKENLITNNQSLLMQGNTAFHNLAPWLKGNVKGQLSDLQKFTEDVSKYVKMAAMPFEADSYEAMFLKLASLAQDLLEDSFLLNHELQNLLAIALKSQERQFYSKLWQSILISLIGSAIVAALYLTRMIRHPLENLAHAAQEMSKGKITIRVPITTKDEVASVAEAFNQMAEYFEKILKKAGTIIDQIFATSTNISSHTKEFESNMNTQEGIVRQITLHATYLQKGEEAFVEVLQSANKAAAATGTLAELGHVSLHEMETIMHEMLSASSMVVATLSSLREQLVDIHQVIFTIVKIADQSNLLSLNTVIRATKSGSEGRGFVIIADKIREMAEQIAFATLDIEKVVEDIVGEVQMTVQEVERFSSQILTQVKETTGIGNQLKHLIDTTQEEVTDFEKINEGMQDQTKGIIAINQVIEELGSNVKEASFAVKKLYLEIEYLYESSFTLRDTFKKFNQ